MSERLSDHQETDRSKYNKFTHTLAIIVAALCLSSSCSNDDPTQTPKTPTVETIVNTGPKINIVNGTFNFVGGELIKIIGNELFFGKQKVAYWDGGPNLNVTLSLNGTPIQPNSIMNANYEGDIVVTITDTTSHKEAKGKIELKNALLEYLKNLKLKVGNPVNFLGGITFSDGVQLKNVRIEQNGIEEVISDPYNYPPTQCGDCLIIITYILPNGEEVEVKVQKNIEALEYIAPQLEETTVENVIPALKDVRTNADAIEYAKSSGHLTAIAMCDVMYKKGTTTMTAEQVRERFRNIVVTMVHETPPENYNFVTIGHYNGEPSTIHSVNEATYLFYCLPNCTLAYLNTDENPFDVLYNYCQNQDLFVITASAVGELSENQAILNVYKECVKKLSTLKNLDFNVCATNRNPPMYKLLCKDQPSDPNGGYGLPSYATPDYPNITACTGIRYDGGYDINNYGGELSMLPVGFKKEYVHAAKPFIIKEGDKLSFRHECPEPSSTATYAVAVKKGLGISLAATMTNNLQEAMEIVNSSTKTYTITDNEYSQPVTSVDLVKIENNLMPQNLPSKIGPGESIILEKGVYTNITFTGPCEVFLNGKWVNAAENAELLKNVDISKLQRRIRYDFLRQYTTTGNEVEFYCYATDTEGRTLPGTKKTFKVTLLANNQTNSPVYNQSQTTYPNYNNYSQTYNNLENVSFNKQLHQLLNDQQNNNQQNIPTRQEERNSRSRQSNKLK